MIFIIDLHHMGFVFPTYVYTWKIYKHLYKLHN
jgi:hypothetical protein